MSYKIGWCWCRLVGNLLFASVYAQFSHDVRKHAHAKEICLADFPEGRGSCVRQVISFAMYAFRRLRGSRDRFLNPWENSCRGCWSCRGTVWICAPVSDPRRSCLSRRQLRCVNAFRSFRQRSIAARTRPMPRNRLQIPITQPECHSFSASSSPSPQFGILQKIFVIFFTFRVMANVPSVNNSQISLKRAFREHTPPKENDSFLTAFSVAKDSNRAGLCPAPRF